MLFGSPDNVRPLHRVGVQRFLLQPRTTGLTVMRTNLQLSYFITAILSIRESRIYHRILKDNKEFQETTIH